MFLLALPLGIELGNPLFEIRLSKTLEKLIFEQDFKQVFNMPKYIFL